MKTINGIITTVIILCVFQVSSAFARQIDCPVAQVRTEITTSLPGPWWQTPQVGNLQNTRIAEIGGETTLICEYRAYGTNISVMRIPPEQFQNCTPNSDGFQCRRTVMASVTYRTGPLSIPQTWRADLDSGAIGSGTADIWFQAATATERYVTPVNGARIGIYDGGSGIAKHDCATTPKSNDRIALADLPVGTYVCVRTSDNRHAVFRVNAAVGPSPGTLEIGFTTWQ